MNEKRIEKELRNLAPDLFPRPHAVAGDMTRLDDGYQREMLAAGSQAGCVGSISPSTPARQWPMQDPAGAKFRRAPVSRHV
jgi:hypothetical protein